MNGKWILKDIETGNGKKGYPGFQMLEIKDSIAAFYTDFPLKKKYSNLKVLDRKIVTMENGKFANYEMVNDDHLKLIIEGKTNGKDSVFECDFYRLEPTLTILKKEEIEKLTFVILENERESEFVFNIELWGQERLERHNRKEGEKKLIEQIDSTFFISMYSNGKRDGSIPIKEVSTEILKLYAIPTGPMEMIAYRKE
ncbi:MAG: hypothetical protein RIB64_07035 [Arenibacter algicola]